MSRDADSAVIRNTALPLTTERIRLHDAASLSDNTQPTSQQCKHTFDEILEGDLLLGGSGAAGASVSDVKVGEVIGAAGGWRR